MANIIYDERTPHSRLMVGCDRYGISIREWSDEVPEGETGFSVQDGFFTWRAWRERERCYSGDDGSGRMRARLVAGALSLMAYYGGSSNNSGVVSSLGEYINGSHVFNC